MKIFTGRIKFVVGLLISRQDYVGEYQQELRNLSIYDFVIDQSNNELALKT